MTLIRLIFVIGLCSAFCLAAKETVVLLPAGSKTVLESGCEERAAVGGHRLAMCGTTATSAIGVVDMEVEDVFVVTGAPAAAVVSLGVAGVRVLGGAANANGETITVIASPSTAAVADLLAALEYRADVLPVPRRAVTTARVPAHIANLDASVANEDVQELVDAVSRARLVANVETLEDYYTRYSLSSEVRQAEAYLASRLTALGLVNVRTEYFRTNYGYNVLGEILGTVDPTQYVIVGAHFDSIPSSGRAPGADDNGSGSSAVLELAEVVATSGKRFAYTIRFAFWCGEEQGLLGSAHHANAAAQNNTDIIAYLNADMLGWTIPGQPITLAMKSVSSTQWLNELAIDLTHTYVPALQTGYSSSCCSDWISFYNVGYAAVGYFENVQSASAYPCYHRSCDLSTEINFEQVELHTKAFLAGMATLAEVV